LSTGNRMLFLRGQRSHTPFNHDFSRL
jgi:hypothetical protein